MWEPHTAWRADTGCNILVCWLKNVEKIILTCFSLLWFCCHQLWFCYNQLLVCHFCPHGPLLGHLAGVRKFLLAFFHWKAKWGLGVREGLLFICFCLCIKDRMNVRELEGEGESEPQFVLACCCVSHICICVFGGENWVAVSCSWTCLMYCDNSVRYVAFMGTPCPGDTGE